MRIALAQTGTDLALVCDFAHELRVVDSEAGAWREISRVDLSETEPRERARRIAASGAEILLCGSCSRELLAALTPLGLRIVTAQPGPADTALSALLAGRVAPPRPCRRRRRCRCGPSLPTVRKVSAMPIAIATRSHDLDSELDPQFGRAACFFLADESGKGSFLDNPHHDGQHGAGLRTAAFLVDLGVNTVIACEVGPKALAVLREGGCACYGAGHGKLREVLAAWQAGELKRLDTN
jgi:predicted Fe-Mo cluster-binding NifX family protein